jgi:hypothetical protein
MAITIGSDLYARESGIRAAPIGPFRYATTKDAGHLERYHRVVGKLVEVLD